MRKALVVLIFVVMAGCAEPLPAPDVRPTIVSLNPCTDAILAEVAEPAQLRAISHYSHDPRSSSMPLAEALRWPVTGGTVEEVLALDPDIVVAGTFLPPATIAALERLGIRVELVGIAASVEESKVQIRRLAALAGHPERGQVLSAHIDAAMMRSRHTGAKIPTLLWQQGGIVPGAEALIVQLMDHAGLASHSAARGLGQGAYLPLEQVLADPPALILATGEERMLRHRVLQAIPNIRHETLDPSMLFCGGPTIIRAVERLAQVRGT